MIEKQEITILHLSDLQFGKNHRFKRLKDSATSTKSFDSLYGRLKIDLENLKKVPGLVPDLVAVTGDIAEWGKDDEFEEALRFFKALAKYLNLPVSRILVVPGNHDINRKLCEAYFNECEGNDQTPQSPYFRKWTHYISVLFEKLYEDVPQYTFTENTPWTLFEVEELKLVVAGLNSTWNESHLANGHYGFIGEPQLRWFKEKLDAFADRGWFRLGLLHHNLIQESPCDKENLHDRKDLEQIIGSSFNLLLHGHRHESQISWLSIPQTRPVLSTGSAGVNPAALPWDVSNQYQIIQVCKDKLWYGGRAYKPREKRWVGDTGISSNANDWFVEIPFSFDGVHSTSMASNSPSSPSGVFDPHGVLPVLQEPERDFVGRETEIERLAAAVAATPAVVCLWGMPGVGKTQTSLAVAQKVRATFPDGQLFVNLRGVDENPMSPADAIKALIYQLYPEIKLPPNDDALLALYRRIFTGKRLLIFADNAQNETQLRDLVPFGESALLITSRQQLSIPRAVSVNLEVLSPEASDALLLSICPRIADEASRISELCGNLPLALRAAAAYLSVTPDEEVRDYRILLENEFLRLEKIGDIGVERSIPASITLSYEKLTASQKRTFSRLSIFPSSFNQDAAVAVTGMSCADTVRDLRRRSLLLYDEGLRRYAMHDLIKLYATLLVAPAARPALEVAFSKHYLEIIRKISSEYAKGGATAEACLAEYDVEFVNIETAEKYALKNVGQSIEAAEIAIELPVVGNHVFDFRLPAAKRAFWSEEALNLIFEREKPRLCIEHLNILGNANFDLAEFPKALTQFNLGLELAQKSQNISLQGDFFLSLGNLYSRIPNVDEAIRCYEKAGECFEKLEGRSGWVKISNSIGQAYMSKCDWENADRVLCEALRFYREKGDFRNQAKVLSNLGLRFLRSGNEGKSKTYFILALRIFKKLKDSPGILESLGNLATVEKESGDQIGYSNNPEAASKHYRKADALFGEIQEQFSAAGNRRNLATTLGNRGCIRLALKKYTDAENFFLEQQQAAEQIGHLEAYAESQYGLGRVYTKTNRASEAQRKLNACIDLFQACKNVAGEAKARFTLSEVQKRLGLPEQAVEELLKSIELYRSIGDRRADRIEDILANVLESISRK